MGVLYSKHSRCSRYQERLHPKTTESALLSAVCVSRKIGFRARERENEQEMKRTERERDKEGRENGELLVLPLFQLK